MGAIVLALLTVALLTYAVTGPGRAQFIRECLDATPTSKTRKFDDYSIGSYHISKSDLVQGIEQATISQPGKLRAVIIFGPTGPLWTYHVLVALSEGNSVRLNSLVMPHARITGKGTGTFTGAEFEQLLNKFNTSKLLTEAVPSSTKVDPLAREFAYDLLVASWTNGGRSLRFGQLAKLKSEADPDPDIKEAQALLEQLNAMLKVISKTYP